jgi:DNA-binding transcriptional regulator YhcF (GntR family)
MNDTPKKDRGLLIYFTPIYKLPLRTKVLGAVERGLLVFFATYDDLGCFWTQSQLAEHFECGPRQLRRALLRLQFLKIIEIEQGQVSKTNPPRREPNRYTFIVDPYQWRLTKDLHEKIIIETKKMGKEPRAFAHEPFADPLELEINFLKEHPQVAAKKKGRRKKTTEKTTRPIVAPPPPPQNNENQWRTKVVELLSDEMSFARLAWIYRKNYEAVELARNAEDHGFSHEQKNYYEKLHHIFSERHRRATDDEMKNANFIKSWELMGFEEETILEMLEKLEQPKTKEDYNENDL